MVPTGSLWLQFYFGSEVSHTLRPESRSMAYVGGIPNRSPITPSDF